MAYQNKGKALDSFLASYKELQEKELFKYAVEAETRALQFNADIVVLAGDFNQCGNTNDHVGTVGLVPHKVFLERLGFFEDETAREPTTFDPAKPDHIPRRLDRVFFKVISDKWRVTGVNTRIVHPPATSWRLESLSDHALFVTADFQVVKTQNSKI